MEMSYNELQGDEGIAAPTEGDRVKDAKAKDSSKPPGSIAPEHESVCAATVRLFCKCASSARVPLVQRWEMDPLRKWYHYNVFPRTLFLHIALVATVTAQIVLINGATSQFSQNLHNSWVQWLYPGNYGDFVGNSLTYPGDEYFLYRSDLVNESVTTLLTNYFSLNKQNTFVPDIIDVYAGSRSTEGMSAPSITFSTYLPLEVLTQHVGRIIPRKDSSLPGKAPLGKAVDTSSSRRGRGAKRPVAQRDGFGNVVPLQAHAKAPNIALDAIAAPLHPVIGLADVTQDVTHVSASTTVLVKDGGVNEVVSSITSMSEFALWQSTFMPNADATAFFLQNIISFQVDLQAKTYNTAQLSMSSGVCLLWQISVEYIMSSHGVVQVHMDDEFNTCNAGWSSPSPLMFLAAAIVLLAILQQLTITRSCLKQWQVIQWSSILQQTSRFHARQMLIKRRLATLNRRIRLQAAIRVANARKRHTGAAGTPSKASPGPSLPESASIATQPPPKVAWHGVHEFQSAQEAAKAGKMKIPKAQFPSDLGILDTGAWPLVAAFFGLDKPVHSHFGSNSRYVDHLAGEDASVESSSSSSSSSDEQEVGDDRTSCSCSSSEFSVSSDSDVEDPNLVYLGLVQPRKRRRRRVSMSSSSSSSSSASTSVRMKFTAHNSHGSHTDRSSSSSDASKRRNKRKMAPLRSLAQQAAQATRLRDRTRERRRSSGSDRKSATSSSSSTPSGIQKGKHRRKTFDREVRFTANAPHRSSVEAAVAPTSPSVEAVQHDPANGFGSPDLPKSDLHKIDWSQPDMVRRSTRMKYANTPLLKAVHTLRHASSHVKPKHLLALVDPWFTLSTLANVFNAIYACNSLIVGEASVPGPTKLLLGLAAALDWITLIHYLKYNGNYYLMIRTFSTSGPAIIRNVIGALPIYFTFVVVAALVFGSLTERFNSLPWTAIAFFAVANGDVVRESFQMTLYYQIGWFFQALAQTVMYVFCLLFIYIILKTTTAINEQSYVLVRPIPKGLKPGARAEDVPDAMGRADISPLAFRLPLRVRKLLFAMQFVRRVGGAVGPVVNSAAASMPDRAHYWCNCLHRSCCRWACMHTLYRLFCCCCGSDWRLNDAHPRHAPPLRSSSLSEPPRSTRDVKKALGIN